MVMHECGGFVMFTEAGAALKDRRPLLALEPSHRIAFERIRPVAFKAFE
jgi:hypothetical protein